MTSKIFLFNVLYLGDIFGKAGRNVVRDFLPELKRQLEVDLVIANSENAMGGRGISPSLAEELFGYGIACLTGGNHSFYAKEIEPYLENEPRLLRPANYPDPCPGNFYAILDTHQGFKVAVGNLMGRVFIPFSLDCPFKAADKMLQRMHQEGGDNLITIIDFHAEATAEKKAMAFYLDGKVSALVGTHTHVQTSDAQILPQGTAYITDLGMTGPQKSIIGMEPKPVLKSFLLGRKFSFHEAKSNPSMQGALMSFGEDGKAVAIETFNYPKVF
ncbi:MAG: YmdB family metallophosphoesterase [Deltaproteobacteria bacterium]|jgi:metallophosphoesterase (TIGR00282 family)|nr:YmdB family metallophosphoesterase [Deltaproteobacteria bacterium]